MQGISDAWHHYWGRQRHGGDTPVVPIEEARDLPAADVDLVRLDKDRRPLIDFDDGRLIS